MFNLISGFSMSECSDLISCAYNASAWYQYLARDSKQNRKYWLEKAEQAEQLGKKLNAAYSKELYGE